MKLFLIQPRGFCAGVVRAIETVEKALELYGAPIYVKHQIVHNQHVVDRLEKMGAIFIEDLKDVPRKSKLIYSAHGVSPEVRKEAKERELDEIDATCSLVTRVHSAVLRYAKLGYKIVLIGHKNHVEVIGTLGEAPEVTTVVESIEDIKKLPFTSEDKIFYVTQTTLSLYDLQGIIQELLIKFPQAETLPTSSICYATTNRQTALKYIASFCDLVLVVGDKKSSNSNRLCEVALHYGKPSYLIQKEQDIDPIWLAGCQVIALTAGASTPEDVVQRCVEQLQNFGVKTIEAVELIKEEVVFKLPKFR